MCLLDDLDHARSPFTALILLRVNPVTFPETTVSLRLEKGEGVTSPHPAAVPRSGQTSGRQPRGSIRPAEPGYWSHRSHLLSDIHHVAGLWNVPVLSVIGVGNWAATRCAEL